MDAKVPIIDINTHILLHLFAKIIRVRNEVRLDASVSGADVLQESVCKNKQIIDISIFKFPFIGIGEDQRSSSQ